MKPWLVGMINPYSKDPDHALAPYPKQSAGYRLFKMFADLDPIYTGQLAEQVGRTEYMNAFHRANLFTGSIPSTRDAWHGEALRLLETIPTRSQVILLGADVREAFSPVLSRPLPRLLIHPQEVDGITWRQLPHPSGRGTSYNDPVMRMLAGMTLADALQHSKEI